MQGDRVEPTGGLVPLAMTGSSPLNSNNLGHQSPEAEWFQEQLLQVAISMGLGGVSLAIYLTGRVNLMLAPKFHAWLLAGAVALLLVGFIRAVLLARAARMSTLAPSTSSALSTDGHHHAEHAHEDDHHHHHHHDDCCGAHSHAHDGDSVGKSNGGDADHRGEACCGEHKHGSDCGHDHDHQWLPLQVMVLSIPMVLFALNLPNEAFGAMKALDLDAYSLSPSGAGAGSGGKADGVSFLQLERAASNPEARGLYEGKTVQLVGKFVGDHDKRFTLIRYKMNCCAADAVPLNAAIMVDPQSPARLDFRHWSGKWVEVNGEVRFLQSRDGKSYLAALILRAKDSEELNKSEAWIKETVPDSPFLTN